jgi:DNA-binding transcriptional LysR family regulator
MNGIDWEHLRHFAALARQGGLSGAAAELGVSQVTVMRRVRALEDMLGIMLFLRRRDGHRLTAIGTELFRAVAEANELLADGVQRVSARNARHARVRIVTTELVANHILLPYLAKTVRRGPLPPIEIDASPSEKPLLDDADTIAVRFRRPISGNYRVRRLGELPFGLYAARGSKAEGHIGWAGDLRDVGMSRWLDATFAGREPALTLTTLDGHLRAARSGIGVAGLPRFVAARDPELVEVASSNASFNLTAWLVIAGGIGRQVRIKKVTQLIVAAFRER